MNKGAWWAPTRGITNSQLQLSTNKHTILLKVLFSTGSTNMLKEKGILWKKAWETNR